MNNNKKALAFFGILIIICLCISFTTKSFQNDTFYTIKIGKDILKYGIDMKDHYSWHNLSYTYPHWLYDIIIYFLYSKFEFSGLYIFTILCFIFIGMLFFFMNIKLNKSYFFSILFTISSIMMLARNATTRAQLFTYFLFLLEVYFIERLLSSSNKKYIVGLFIICLLIANLHAAVWPFYFILMLPYLVSQLISYIVGKYKLRIRNNIFIKRFDLEYNNNVKYLVIVFIISLFIGLITPIGFTPYTYFIKIMMGNTMEYIEEHKPLVLIQNAFVWGYILILLFPLIFTKVKIKLSDAFMIFGLLFMTFLSVRHISFLATVGMFCLCRVFCSIGLIKSDEYLDFEIPLWGSFIVFITVIISSMIVYNVNSKSDFIDDYLYPVEMVNYMYDELDMKKVKLYNEYDFGSYLLYRNIDVYIDSRSDLYTEPFNGKFDIFDECMNISSNYGRVFNKYDITHILTYKDTYLSQILAASPNYDVVHKEGRFVLYEYLGNDEEE